MKKRKRLALLLSLIMLFSAIPQGVFAAGAETEPSIKWPQFVFPGFSGQESLETVEITGLEAKDIGAESSDQEILPNALISVQESTAASSGGSLSIEIAYLPLKEGSVTITLYSKEDSEIKASQEFTIIKGDADQMVNNVWIGKTREAVGSFTMSLLSYRVEDTSIATVDSKGNVTGKSQGETVLHINSEQVPEMDLTRKIKVSQDPTGIYYNDSPISELNWDKDQGELQLKVIDGSYFSHSDITSTAAVYDSSNTDVAVPEYKLAASHTGPGKISFKKNGTVTINVYKSVKRADLVGSIKITVTGFDETSDLDSGWKTQEQGQGYNSKIQILNFPVENQSFNEAYFENQITDYIKSDTAKFSLELTATGKKDETTEEDQKVYEAAVLKGINIYEKQEDGSLGDKVAAHGKGYELESSSYETQNSTVVRLNLAVDKGVLQKGKTYILAADSDVSAYPTEDAYQHPEYDYKVTYPLAVPVSWTFTTIGGAKTIALDKSSISMLPGQSQVLTATMNKDEKVEADDTVSWKSSNSEVASVDNSGKVTAKKAGAAVITATAVDGKVSAQCNVTVSPVRVTGIKLNVTSAAIDEGKTLALKATIAPADAADKNIIWSSSNPKAAAVDAKGVVTGVAPGQATIQAKTADGSFTASAVITVRAVKVTKVTANASKVTLTAGKTRTLKATVYPSNASDKSVSWSSSNKKVARVDAKGKVTAVAPGKAVITVKTKDSSRKATVTVNVRPRNTTLKLKGKRSAVTVTYKKVKGVTAYQIYRAQKKNGTYKRVTTRSYKKVGKYTNSRLKRKKTYYYKVRTYKTVKGKRIYSSFSAAKKVRTK